MRTSVLDSARVTFSATVVDVGWCPALPSYSTWRMWSPTPSATVSTANLTRPSHQLALSDEAVAGHDADASARAAAGAGDPHRDGCRRAVRGDRRARGRDARQGQVPADRRHPQRVRGLDVAGPVDRAVLDRRGGGSHPEGSGVRRPAARAHADLGPTQAGGGVRGQHRHLPVGVVRRPADGARRVDPHLHGLDGRLVAGRVDGTCPDCVGAVPGDRGRGARARGAQPGRTVEGDGDRLDAGCVGGSGRDRDRVGDPPAGLAVDGAGRQCDDRVGRVGDRDGGDRAIGGAADDGATHRERPRVGVRRRVDVVPTHLDLLGRTVTELGRDGRRQCRCRALRVVTETSATDSTRRSGW